MNRRFARSPVMEQQNQPPQDQSPANRAGPLVEPNRNPDQGQDGDYSAQNPIPTAENWDSRPASRPLLLIIAVVGVVAVILFALSMCTTSVRTAAVGDGDNDANPAQILQRNVNEAFSTGGAPSPASQPQQQTTVPAQTTPPPAAMQGRQQLEDLQEQQERILQEQRNAIPSLLPENPPEPAALGPY